MRHPPNETPNLPLPAKRKGKRIEAHTDAELDAAVDAAVAKFGDDFWIMLHGIDAYMCRRKRRIARRMDRVMTESLNDVMREESWGDS
jgi:hypothetical protein